RGGTGGECSGGSEHFGGELGSDGREHNNDTSAALAEAAVDSAGGRGGAAGGFCRPGGVREGARGRPPGSPPGCGGEWRSDGVEGWRWPRSAGTCGSYRLKQTT